MQLAPQQTCHWYQLENSPWPSIRWVSEGWRQEWMHKDVMARLLPNVAVFRHGEPLTAHCHAASASNIFTFMVFVGLHLNSREWCYFRYSQMLVILNWVQYSCRLSNTWSCSHCLSSSVFPYLFPISLSSIPLIHFSTFSRSLLALPLALPVCIITVWPLSPFLIPLQRRHCVNSNLTKIASWVRTRIERIIERRGPPLPPVVLKQFFFSFFVFLPH